MLPNKHELANMVAEKRAKFRQEERMTTIKHMRESLPILTKVQVRRYRLPYYDALLEELEECNAFKTARYLKDLIKHQAGYKKEYTYDLMIQSLPDLKTNIKELKVLYESLKIGEQSLDEGDVTEAICQFLTLGEHFGLYSTDWIWLAEQLFSQAVAMSDEYVDDHGYTKALSCYVYGNYLHVQKLDVDKSIEFLNLSRSLSKGTDWTAYNLHKEHTKPLFVMVCTLLYKILYNIASGLVLSDPEEALIICKIAKKRVFEACLPRGDIYCLQGKCEIEVNQAADAVPNFIKACRLYKSNNEVEKLCEARIQLALAYLEIDDWKKSYKELKELLEFAEKNNLKNYIGRAHLYCGQYYLNQGMPQRATPLLLIALDIFHELNEVSNREFVSNLAAVSGGLEKMTNYINLILKCEFTKGVIKTGHILSLIAWKDSRHSFWDHLSANESVVLDMSTSEQGDIKEKIEYTSEHEEIVDNDEDKL